MEEHLGTFRFYRKDWSFCLISFRQKQNRVSLKKIFTLKRGDSGTFGNSGPGEALLIIGQFRFLPILKSKMSK